MDPQEPQKTPFSPERASKRGTGQVTFQSDVEAAGADTLFGQMMSHVAAGQSILGSKILSWAIEEVSRRDEDTIVAARLVLRLESGATIEVSPGNFDTFIVKGAKE